ncbi:hypothetical protein QQ054_12335, partial [Oscillatoria amoena NRMC-F 0135]|nr:hypothetical protein [Oscillatoria amoena NRMC-F 0135]
MLKTCIALLIDVIGCCSTSRHGRMQRGRWPGPRPCTEKNPVTADFKIEELYRNLEEDYAYYETDTITRGTAK